MSRYLSALLLASVLTQADAQSSAFHYREARAPVPGTVWHFSKSNIDGSAPWHLDLYVASPTRIDVVKWVEGASDFVEVSADIDFVRGMPVNLQQWNTTRNGREPRLWANHSAGQLTVKLAGGPSFQLGAEQPLHLWGFDLMGLAFMLPHLAKPASGFDILVVDPNRPGSNGAPFAQGIAHFEAAGEEKLGAIVARKYRISGAVFGDKLGWIWVEKGSGRLLRAEHPVPTSTDWNDWKLEALGVEQMDGIAWEQFKTQLAEQVGGKPGAASLAAQMHAVYEKSGIEAVLAGITQWRVDTLKGLEADLNTVGYTLLGADKVADALQLFTRITQDYPESANAWDSLAEAQIANGDKSAARESFQRVLALAPDDQHAREQLKLLGD